MMFEECFYRVSIKAIVLDTNKRILLSLDDEGYWDFLGGGLEHEEKPTEALIREIYEESGLETTWVSPTPKYLVTALRPNKNGYTANVLYEVGLANLHYTQSDECRDLQYFTIKEARALQLPPNVTAFLDVFDPNLHNDRPPDTNGIIIPVINKGTE